MFPRNASCMFPWGRAVGHNRGSIRAMSAALLFLYMTASASAGDYKVAYALEVGDQKDTGKISGLRICIDGHDGDDGAHTLQRFPFI